MSERGMLRKFNGVGREKPIQMQRKDAESFEGVEKTAERVSIQLSEADEMVEGMMFVKPKRIHGKSETKEEYFEDWKKQWTHILQMNQRRRGEGKEMLTIPGTVRAFQNEEEFGLLMTDLTEQGKKEVHDFKYFRDQISAEQWGDIRTQIEKDLRVAQEENLLLGGSTFALDSWLLVHDPATDSYTTCVVDLGRETRVDADPELVKARILEIRKDLDRASLRAVRNEIAA